MRDLAKFISEAIHEPTLVVLDNWERAAAASSARTAIRSFVEYLPDHSRVVIAGRGGMADTLTKLEMAGEVLWLRDDDLAITVEELDRWAEAAAVEREAMTDLWVSSRGWLAPLALFVHHRGNARATAAAVDSFISAEIFDPLSPMHRSFLLDTCLLDFVTLDAARAVCEHSVGDEFSSVASLPLPIRRVGPDMLVYHPVFRSFLRMRLQTGSRSRELVTKRQVAAWHGSSGDPVACIDMLIEINELDEAASAFELGARTLLEGAEWDTVLRFAEAIDKRRVETRPLLIAAVLRALRSVFRLDDTRKMILELDASGRLAEVVAADPTVLPYTLGALLWHPDETLRLLNRYDNGPAVEGIRYMLLAMTADEPAKAPENLVWAGRRTISWGLMMQGRLSDLVAMLAPPSQWPPTSPHTTPHPLLGLVWRGELGRARELFDLVTATVKSHTREDLWLYLEGLLLLAEGHVQRALAAAEAAVRHAQHAGTVGFLPAFQHLQARALIELGRIHQAEEILHSALVSAAGAGLSVYVEWNLTTLGQAYLLQGDSTRAAEVLRSAARDMRRSGRLLLLPMTAVYLAEAEARLGNSREARAAADLAHVMAEETGSVAALDAALRHFPRVSEYHSPSDTGRLSPLNQVGTSAWLATSRPTKAIAVEVRTFGPVPDIYVNGASVNARRAKVVELLALVTMEGALSRDDALVRLFPDGDPRRSSNYLRQLLHQASRLIGLPLHRAADSSLSWPPDVEATTTDLEFERVLRLVARAPSRDRLTALVAAVRPLLGLTYLAASELDWAATRRQELEKLKMDTVAEIADIACALEDYDVAREFGELSVASYPFSPTGYRALIRVETATGTKAGAIAVYRLAIGALSSVGLELDPKTAALIDHSR